MEIIISEIWGTKKGAIIVDCLNRMTFKVNKRILKRLWEEARLGSLITAKVKESNGTIYDFPEIIDFTVIEK